MIGKNHALSVFRLPFVDKKGSLKTLYRLFVHLLCAKKGSLKIF
nr:hypothetical protein [uncultured Kingella sp.]